MQQLLIVAIHNVGLPKYMIDAIIELCNLFRQLCSKNNKAEDFENLHTDIGPILCKLEERYSPAFFVLIFT